ncbi:MAG TPA: sugar ABC transporter substrate-binding protein [Limnochordia bacterium]
MRPEAGRECGGRLALAVCLGLSAFIGAAEAEPVTLTFWEAHSAQEEAATAEMVALFERENPDIDVAMIRQDFGTNFEKVFLAVAGGVAPDVTPIWGGLLSSFAARSALIDLTSFGAAALRAAFFDGAWQFTQHAGRTWGVPYAADPRFLVYNRAMLDEAGIAAPPSTWEELIDAARKLMRRTGDRISVWGFAFWPNVDLYSTLLWSAGGDFFSADGKRAAFDSPAGVRALQFLVDLYRSHGVASLAGRAEFVSGRVAMYYDGPWIAYEQALQAPELEYGVAHMPSPAGGVRVNQASIGAYAGYAHSEHPEAVYRFLSFMGSRAAQAIRVRHLKTAVRPDVVGEAGLAAVFDAHPQLREMHEILVYSRIYPVHPRWGDVVTILDAALLRAVEGEVSAQAALSAAAAQVNQILAETTAGQAQGGERRHGR